MKKDKFVFNQFKIKQQLAQIKFDEIKEGSYDGHEGIVSQVEKHGVIIPYSSLNKIQSLDEIINSLEKENGPTELPPQ